MHRKIGSEITVKNFRLFEQAGLAGFKPAVKRVPKI